MSSPPDRALIESFDALLLDLDGVVYIGAHPVAHAASAIQTCRTQYGVSLAFVTNNASRTPESVASQLRDVGLSAQAGDVVTSAQVAASYLAARLPVGSKVLVVGGAGLLTALTENGLTPVWQVTDNPVAVAQGFDPDVNWRMLAQAAAALHTGVPWVASNLDMTFPTELGPAPGNGSLVAALTTATGRVPVSVGKPAAPLILEGVRRIGARRPLVVGDRLDTDIQAANTAELESLLVLTGISTPADLCAAPQLNRPTYVGADLRALLVSHQAVVLTSRPDGSYVCTAGNWSIETVADRVTVLSAGEDRVEGIRAVAAVAWAAADAGLNLVPAAGELATRLWRAWVA